MKANQLTQEEYAPWYANYIAKAGDNDLIEELEISVHRLIRFVQNIPMDKFDYRYAEGKWTMDLPKVTHETVSSDGWTRKYLLELNDGQTIETVLMGYPGCGGYS